MEKQWKGILWSHFLWRLKGNYNCFLLGKICLEAFSKLDLKEVTFFTFALCNISDIFFFLISYREYLGKKINHNNSREKS